MGAKRIFKGDHLFSELCWNIVYIIMTSLYDVFTVKYSLKYPWYALAVEIMNIDLFFPSPVFYPYHRNQSVCFSSIYNVTN